MWNQKRILVQWVGIGTQAHYYDIIDEAICYEELILGYFLPYDPQTSKWIPFVAREISHRYSTSTRVCFYCTYTYKRKTVQLDEETKLQNQVQISDRF